MAKRFRMDTSNDRFSYEREIDSLEEERAMDGLYVIRADASPTADL